MRKELRKKYELTPDEGVAVDALREMGVSLEDAIARPRVESKVWFSSNPINERGRRTNLLIPFYPTDFGFPDGTDLENLYCDKWFRVNTSRKEDVSVLILAALRGTVGSNVVVKDGPRISDIWVYFYGERISASGGKLKIRHARGSLRFFYGEGIRDGCTSIPIGKLKRDIETGTIEELSEEQLQEFRESGEMERFIEADREWVAWMAG